MVAWGAGLWFVGDSQLWGIAVSGLVEVSRGHAGGVRSWQNTELGDARRARLTECARASWQDPAIRAARLAGFRNPQTPQFTVPEEKAAYRRFRAVGMPPDHARDMVVYGLRYMPKRVEPPPRPRTTVTYSVDSWLCQALLVTARMAHAQTGRRMPTTRALAQMLKVSSAPVVFALAVLQSAGLLTLVTVRETHVSATGRRGSHVRQVVAWVAPKVV